MPLYISADSTPTAVFLYEKKLVAHSFLRLQNAQRES